MNGGPNFSSVTPLRKKAVYNSFGFNHLRQYGSVCRESLPYPKRTKQLTISNDVNGKIVFDPGAPVVFYPIGSWNDAIFAFNLDTRKSTRFDLPIHSFRGLLAAKREDRGFLFAYLKQGSKSDRIDARKLAELLRSNLLRPVYHGEHGVRPLKELARSYLTITRDQARVMTRLKAVYRSWAIPCAGKQVYGQRHRLEWLGKIQEAGVRRRAEFYYVQLDALRSLRLVVRRELLLESRKHDASKLLSQIPSIGPIRAALLIALLQTPDRFRTKRQLWAYSGLAIETDDSAENQYVNGQLQRSRKQTSIRGLNQNHNHDLKNLFKSASAVAAAKAGPFQKFYDAQIGKGLKPEMARLTLARKIAAITLIVWKKGVGSECLRMMEVTSCRVDRTLAN
jgi:Transposase IS116/IS110/IS902 family/Transposase